MAELASLKIDAKQIERFAEKLGREIAADEKQMTEPMNQNPLSKTLYLGLDGTGIPMRACELT